MTPLRSALIGLAAGALAYVGIAAFLHPASPETASIGDTVGQSASPTVSPVTNGVRGDKSGDKTSDTKMSPVLSPKPVVTNFVTTSVTPRVSALPVASPASSATPTPTYLATSSPAPQVTPRTPTPTPATPTPTPTPSLTPTPTPEPSSTPTPTPTPTPAPASVRVVINEIAWAGTASGSSDEWLELYNAGESAVDLTGWTLHGDPDTNGNTRIITLSGSVGAGQYYLIERTDDTTISDIQADVFGSFGGSGLRNSPGERLQLRDGSGSNIDVVDCSAGDWFGGSASPGYASMERIDPLGEGSDASNWTSNNGLVTTGLDAAGHPIRGTPKYANSATH